MLGCVHYSFGHSFDLWWLSIELSKLDLLDVTGQHKANDRQRYFSFHGKRWKVWVAHVSHHLWRLQSKTEYKLSNSEQTCAVWGLDSKIAWGKTSCNKKEFNFIRQLYLFNSLFLLFLFFLSWFLRLAKHTLSDMKEDLQTSYNQWNSHSPSRCRQLFQSI